MLKQSDAFNQAFASDERTLAIKVTVGDRSFTAEDLVSVDYDSAAMTGDQMGLGSTYENSVKIAFANLVEDIKAQDKVTVSIGIKLPDGTFEYAPLGVFYVDGEITMDRNNQLTSITAVDGMCWLEAIYMPKVTVPTTLSAMALDIANQAGVTINQDNFAALPNIQITKLPAGQTYRVILGLLAMLIPGYVTFDRAGQLCLLGLNKGQYTVTPDNYEFQGLTKNENAYTVSGITVTPLTDNSYSATASEENTNPTGDDSNDAEDTTAKSLHVGANTGNQLILQNDFIDERILTDIWGVIEEIQYYPYTLNWFGNPAVEAGDWLTVSDTAGNKFVVPNNTFTLNFAGGLSATSGTGESVTSPTVWNARGTLEQTVKQVVRRLNATGTYTFYTPTQPVDASEGDLWYKPNGKTTELWIYSNGQWTLMVSDLTGEKIIQQIDNAQKDIVAARQVADAANAMAGTKVGTDEYNSKITQLANDISLRVTKGDVISQINMEAGQTLIQSGKILLDAPSVVFSGNAFIPDAAIQNLSASKLSAGTLDANVINVINMNANNITAGILSGKNLSLNLETGKVEFQSGDISNATNRFSIDIDAGTVTSTGVGGNTVTLTDGGLDYRKSVNDTDISGQIGLNWHTTGTNIPNLVLQSAGKIILAVDDPIVSGGTFYTNQVNSVVIDSESVTLTSGKGFTSSDSNIHYSNVRVDNTGILARAYPNIFHSEGYYFGVYEEDGVTKSAGINIVGKPIMGSNISITGSVDILGDTKITGKLWTIGSKNAVHVTRDGVRATPAYETAESYLGDIGESVTDETSQVTVPIEILFGDTVNTTIPYQVFLQSYSSNHVWVSSRDDTFFVVQSDQPNTPFVWEIKAKRRGYESDRLVKADVDIKEVAKAEGYKE